MRLPALFRRNSLIVLSELESKIERLPDNLDLPFESLRGISAGLQDIYGLYCFHYVAGRLKNRALVLDLKIAIYKRQICYSPKQAVKFALATDKCKSDICDLFFKHLNHLE